MSVDQAFRTMIRAEIEQQLKPLRNVVMRLEEQSQDLDALGSIARGLAPFAEMLGSTARAPRVKTIPNRATPPRHKAESPDAACAIIGCDNARRAKGYCSAHYQKLRNLVRSDRRPETWLDDAPSHSVEDVVLPRGRAAVRARQQAEA